VHVEYRFPTKTRGVAKGVYANIVEGVVMRKPLFRPEVRGEVALAPCALGSAIQAMDKNDIGRDRHAGMRLVEGC